MKHDNPQLIDALAAEYVLGTLTGPARRRFERWRTQEWHVERRVQAWEERLTGLSETLSPVRPAPHVWAQIEKRIGRTSNNTRPRGQAPETKAASRWQSGPWRAIAASVALIIVLIGGFTTWRSMQAPGFYEMATLSAQAAQPAWHLHVDDELNTIRAVADVGAVAQSGKSYELWALPDNGSAPVSLGLMPLTGSIDRPLSEAQRAALQGASKVAVSLEPAGGSPTGGPTGPVLMVADRVKRA